jgi:hypothetical protein
MSLLVINLMMTAVNRADGAIGFAPARRAPNGLTPLAAGELGR